MRAIKGIVDRRVTSHTAIEIRTPVVLPKNSNENKAQINCVRNHDNIVVEIDHLSWYQVEIDIRGRGSLDHNRGEQQANRNTTNNNYYNRSCWNSSRSQEDYRGNNRKQFN